MKPFIAIMAWTGDNRVAKIQDFDTSDAAAAHAFGHQAQYPGAFDVSTPSEAMEEWLVDPASKTVSISPPDKSAETKAAAKARANDQATLIVAELFVDLIEALLASTTIAATDFDVDTRAKYQTLKGLVDDWRVL